MTSPISTSSYMNKIQLNDEMNVLKRNGSLETVSFDKILQRMKRIGKEAELK